MSEMFDAAQDEVHSLHETTADTLVSINNAINGLRTELDLLEHQRNRLSEFLNSGTNGTGMTAAPPAPSEKRTRKSKSGKLMSASKPKGEHKPAAGRTDWSAILDKLPKAFVAGDVQAVRPGAPTEIFAAITRWIKAGTVERAGRGKYRKV